IALHYGLLKLAQHGGLFVAPLLADYDIQRRLEVDPCLQQRTEFVVKCLFMFIANCRKESDVARKPARLFVALAWYGGGCSRQLANGECVIHGVVVDTDGK